ncbi:glycosyltransferase family 2 protein [Sphingobacterium hungaricum]|uniref:Glycosyltransferase 2-like domain-containing protein n=1 Tax=Sphingobacterium hungaricum TaxID=2082723 RepID=A0A928UVF4_9SPHI|nr:glycosyltransferase family 2 protein [Sphingobacterium hungaricum]MBE8713678.1 hypothetical protein [Sphingobacterium hungaricum]
MLWKSNMDNALVTIFIPVYNAEKYVHAAIKSILEQSFTDFELLIINDGSTDNSLKIIESFDDPRIRIISNEVNIGIGRARALAVEEAKGKYLALLDADDIAYPDRIQKQVDFMELNPSIAASSGFADVIDENSVRTNTTIKVPVGRNLPSLLLFEYVFVNPASIYVLDAVRKAGSYNDQLCEDYDLLVRISRNHKIANIAVPLIQYRVHKDGISKKKLSQMYEQAALILEKQLHFLKIYPNRKEFELYRSLMVGQKLIDSATLEEYMNILLTLLKHNDELGTYEKTQFKSVISQKWQDLIKHFQPKNGFFLLFKSPLFSAKDTSFKTFRKQFKNLFK